MPDALVVNASPLIFLSNAGRLDLLRAAGAPRVLVPQSVFDEVTDTEHSDRAARSIAESAWIERVGPVEIPASVIEWDLGPGESAVIAVALGIPGARVVLDDLAGRRCALALGLDVMGTLGVIIAAHRRGHIEDPHQVVLDLRASGMWLSDAGHRPRTTTSWMEAVMSRHPSTPGRTTGDAGNPISFNVPVDDQQAIRLSVGTEITEPKVRRRAVGGPGPAAPSSSVPVILSLRDESGFYRLVREPHAVKSPMSQAAVGTASCCHASRA